MRSVRSHGKKLARQGWEDGLWWEDLNTHDKPKKLFAGYFGDQDDEDDPEDQPGYDPEPPVHSFSHP